MQNDEINNVQPHDGDALLNAVPGWIKVSDKMPEHNVGVLVFIPKEDFHITAGMWDISNKWVLLDEYRVPDCEVTHWMELPDIPQEFHKERDENNRIMSMLKEYKLGYSNNNCIGCVKGGKGYWNKIKTDFPPVFKRMAELERKVGYSCINGLFLDELTPEMGRMKAEIMPNCGNICEVEFADIPDNNLQAILSGRKSIYEAVL